MQAVILAGGLGTRLRPLTDVIPKPMVRVCGRPFLEYIIEILRKNDITDVFLLTGFLGEVLERHFGNGDAFGVHISYSREIEPLGVSGALRLAYPKLADSFVLLYGDSFLPLDYNDLIRFFEQSNKKAVVVSYQYKSESDRGDDYPHNLRVDGAGHVTGYKQHGIEGGTHAEGGAMVFKKEVIALLPDGHSNALGESLFPGLMQQKEIVTYVSQNRFIDIGTPLRLKKAEVFFKDYTL